MGTTRKVDIAHCSYLSDLHWDLIGELLPEPGRSPLGGQPAASIVMMLCFSCTCSKSSGSAVISLLFSAVASCPSETPQSTAQALTTCSAPSPWR